MLPRPYGHGTTKYIPLTKTLSIAATKQYVACFPVSLRLQKYNKKPKNYHFILKNNYFFGKYVAFYFVCS